MGAGFVQFPLPGVFQVNSGGPRFGPSIDGQFSSGLTTHPYTNGLLDLTNIYQDIIFGNPNFTGGGFTTFDPVTANIIGGGVPNIGGGGFDPFAGGGGGGGGFNPVTGGFTPTNFGAGSAPLPIPGVFQVNSGGPRFGPNFNGQFSSGLSTHPYTNGLLDMVNQFQSIIFASPPAGF